MIPLHDYLAFLSIVTLIVVSPGANLFLLLQATPWASVRRSYLMPLWRSLALGHSYQPLLRYSLL